MTIKEFKEGLATVPKENLQELLSELKQTSHSLNSAKCAMHGTELFKQSPILPLDQLWADVYEIQVHVETLI